MQSVILLAIARQFMCWYGLLGMCLVAGSGHHGWGVRMEPLV